jgi:hypothetical protein
MIFGDTGAAAGPTAGDTPIFRGGCPGTGDKEDSDDLNDPGPGGGSVYLIAQTRIAVNGTINASGAGGASHEGLDPGAGGGSGGFIGLDAPEINGIGEIFANGGGGGGGGGGDTRGNAGSKSTSYDQVGQGGDGFYEGPNDGGGDGGNGSIGPALNGLNGGSSTRTGGGGGGGAGWIYIRTDTLGLSDKLSPSAHMTTRD